MYAAHEITCIQKICEIKIQSQDDRTLECIKIDFRYSTEFLHKTLTAIIL